MKGYRPNCLLKKLARMSDNRKWVRRAFVSKLLVVRTPGLLRCPGPCRFFEYGRLGGETDNPRFDAHVLVNI
ncbi:hypothetical protein OUZ56_012287 [Daphnia magna]|uniref:Uncharacterized protein n=1 Tax=Daphnia magna TaxID=35525 RepID=A0ABQ9Z2K6_9CRUS|nr:hypothetical protein OUZ56_012287 [Daphnia magna]